MLGRHCGSPAIRQPGEQRQQLPQRGRLEPGERRAEAEVDAVPEREVALTVPGDGEPLRVRAGYRLTGH